MNSGEIIAKHSDIVAIADAVRNKTDTTNEMTYDEIINGINGIKTEPDLQNKTITPTASIQTIVADEEYDGLNSVTINGDNNLIPENIIDGVSIFGVEGNVEFDTNTDFEDEIISTRSITNYTNSRVTSIGSYAFAYCSGLISVNFPLVTTINTGAFENCSKLTTTSFPKTTTIGNSAFMYCSKLTSVSFPSCISLNDSAFAYCSGLISVNFPLVTTINNSVFRYCPKLTTISFPKVTKIMSYAFNQCSSLTTASFPKATFIYRSAFRNCLNLKSLYLMNSSLCTLSGSNAFTSTPIGGYSTSAGTYGSIYVPASLLNSYKTATNWTYFSSRFVGV